MKEFEFTCTQYCTDEKPTLRVCAETFEEAKRIAERMFHKAYAYMMPRSTRLTTWKSKFELEN